MKARFQIVNSNAQDYSIETQLITGYLLLLQCKIHQIFL